MKKYRIKWTSLATGAIGYSKPVFDSRDEAERIARELDHQDRDIPMYRIVESVEIDDDNQNN